MSPRPPSRRRTLPSSTIWTWKSARWRTQNSRGTSNFESEVIVVWFNQDTRVVSDEFANFSELDLISIVMSAVCHDYGHDGMNNAYHVNTISDRAIRYSDQSVQENFHAAETFTILNSPETNFMEEFSRDDFKTFRQRFIGIILATDMARHASDLNNMKTLIEQKEIIDGKNQNLVVDKSSTKLEFNSK